MTRTGCTLALALWTCLLAAQPDNSLTPEFSQLSAKERARIAKREQEEAAKDPQYQAVMAKAEDLFKQQQYDEALASFIEARNIRPYNVYPKVKIQDLQALIAKRDAKVVPPPVDTAKTVIVEAPKVAAPPPEPVKQPEPVPQPGPAIVSVAPPVEKPLPGSVKQPEPVIMSVAPPVEKPLPEPKVEVPIERKGPAQPRVVQPSRDAVRVASVPPEPKPVQPDGMTERSYKEGRAVVLERQVVTDGKPVIYKKVTHPWGEPVHFKDGIAIPARVWHEAFGDQ